MMLHGRKFKILEKIIGMHLVDEKRFLTLFSREDYIVEIVIDKWSVKAEQVKPETNITTTLV